MTTFYETKHHLTGVVLSHSTSGGGNIYYVFSILLPPHEIKNEKIPMKTYNMNMECEVVCYIGLLTLCCLHANVHVDHRDLLPAFRYQ